MSDNLYQLSHTISNQLAIITGNADLMMYDENLTQKQRERLSIIVKSSDKIVIAVQKTLDEENRT